MTKNLFEYLQGISPQSKTLMTKRMIQIAIEKEQKDRELCIDLFKEFYMHNALTKEQIRRGFDLIYIDLDDILVDTPKAIDYLFQMISRIVFDIKLFQISFLSRIPEILLNHHTYFDYVLSKIHKTSFKEIIIPKLSKFEQELLYNQPKYKEEFGNLSKTLFFDKNFDNVKIYFTETNPNLFMLHSLFIRKVFSFNTGIYYRL